MARCVARPVLRCWTSDTPARFRCAARAFCTRILCNAGRSYVIGGKRWTRRKWTSVASADRECIGSSPASTTTERGSSSAGGSTIENHRMVTTQEHRFPIGSVNDYRGVVSDHPRFVWRQRSVLSWRQPASGRRPPVRAVCRSRTGLHFDNRWCVRLGTSRVPSCGREWHRSHSRKRDGNFSHTGAN